MGLFRPLVDAGTVLRYAIGESACSVLGPPPEPVGRAVPVSVLDLDLAERGACLEVVLTVAAPSSLQGTIPEVVLASPATSRALFPGFTLRPPGDGPMLAFLAGAAPPGLLAALRTFFLVGEAHPGDLPGEGESPEPQAFDLDLGPELDGEEDGGYLLV